MKDFFKTMLMNYRKRMYYGSEVTYNAHFRNTASSLTYDEMEEHFGENGKHWYENGTFIKVNKVLSNNMTDVNDMTFFIKYPFSSFEEMMKLNLDPQRKLKYIPVYKLTDDYFPRFIETSLVLSTITEFGVDSVWQKRFKENELLREDYTEIEQEISSGKRTLTKKQQKKVEKQLKKYEGYLDNDYVYTELYLPGVYEERGFPKNKYACLDLHEFTDKTLNKTKEQKIPKK